MEDRIYEYIKEYMLKYGYCPSIEEIGEAVGLKSKSSVHIYMDRLESKGKIIRKCFASSVYRLDVLKYVEV
jgi:repressor LexA